MDDHAEHDHFTDDEMRDLLRHVITLIHDGTLPPESEQRINGAIHARHDHHARRETRDPLRSGLPGTSGSGA